MVKCSQRVIFLETDFVNLIWIDNLIKVLTTQNEWHQAPPLIDSQLLMRTVLTGFYRLVFSRTLKIFPQLRVAIFFSCRNISAQFLHYMQSVLLNSQSLQFSPQFLSIPATNLVTFGHNNHDKFLQDPRGTVQYISLNVDLHLISAATIWNNKQLCIVFHTEIHHLSHHSAYSVYEIHAIMLVLHKTPL